MTEGEVGAVLRDAMLTILKIGTPLLGVALAIGLVMSLVQAVTQINEQTLTFVPKFIGIFATLLLLGGFMLSALTDFTRAMFGQLVAVGGS